MDVIKEVRSPRFCFLELCRYPLQKSRIDLLGLCICVTI